MLNSLHNWWRPWEDYVFFFLFRKCRRLSKLWHGFWTAPRGRLWCLYHRTVFHLHGQLPRYTLYLSLSTHMVQRGSSLSTLSLGSTHPVGSGRVLREEGEGVGRGMGSAQEEPSAAYLGLWCLVHVNTYFTLAEPYCWFQGIFFQALFFLDCMWYSASFLH